MSYYLSPNAEITDDDILIFFDIDSTLTRSIDERLLSGDSVHKANMEHLYDNSWQTIGKYDFRQLNASCLALFADLIVALNAKVICISSWTDLRRPEENIQELKSAFGKMCTFPDNWLVGITYGGGGDRNKGVIMPLINDIGFSGKHIAIDDGAFEYADQSNAVRIDGRVGFCIYDYIEVFERLGIEISETKSAIGTSFRQASLKPLKQY